MRILGTIEHQTCKITVFQLEHKYAIKFEDHLYEQTFKIRSNPSLNNFSDIKGLIDDKLIQSVMRRFRSMHDDLEATFVRNLSVAEEDEEFDDII